MESGLICGAHSYRIVLPVLHRVIHQFGDDRALGLGPAPRARLLPATFCTPLALHSRRLHVGVPHASVRVWPCVTVCDREWPSVRVAVRAAV